MDKKTPRWPGSPEERPLATVSENAEQTVAGPSRAVSAAAAGPSSAVPSASLLTPAPTPTAAVPPARRRSGAAKMMTVESETVTSMPTLRHMASSDAMRRKRRRKNPRQYLDSDSEETYVYDSNPPDRPKRRSGSIKSSGATTERRPRDARHSILDPEFRRGPPSPFGHGRKSPFLMSSSMEERTPLIRRRRPSPRHLEAQTSPGYLNRLAACLVVTIMVFLVITGAIGFMFATSQPLTDISLVSMSNVVASEPELLFDMTVGAHNPNVVVVTISDANLEIFARSLVRSADDPDDDASLNIRLGTVTHLDSPLSFEGLFFHQGVSTSTASVRLSPEGEQWRDIVRAGEWELIVKGVVNYRLPLSQTLRSAPVAGRGKVGTT